VRPEEPHEIREQPIEPATGGASGASPRQLTTPPGVSLGKGTLYNVAARVAFIASGYALQFSMARWLASAVEFGRFSVLLSLVTLARMVFSSGVPQAVSKFVAAEQGPAYSTFRRAVAIQLVASLVVWLTLLLLTPALTSFLGDPSLRRPLYLASPLIVLMALYQVNLGYVSGRLWFARQASLTLMTSLSRYAFPAALVLIGWGLDGAVLGLVISGALLAALSWTRTSEEAAPSSVSVQQFLRFSWPLVIFAFGVNALMNFDLLLLKSYFPASDHVGFYGGAANLGKAPYFAFYAFSATALPALSRHHAAGDMPRVRAELVRQIRYLALGLFPAGGLLAASAPETLALVYGRSYSAAAGPLRLLSLSTCALSLLVIMASALTACGRPRTSMVPMVICLPSQWLFGTLLIPVHGMWGAACSNLLATCLGLICAWWLIARTVGNVVQIAVFGTVIGGTLLASCTFLLLPGVGALGLLVKLSFSFLVYVAALIAFERLAPGLGLLEFRRPSAAADARRHWHS
jgi:O-antigen/teichoic acid export membrane protein